MRALARGKTRGPQLARCRRAPCDTGWLCRILALPVRGGPERTVLLALAWRLAAASVECPACCAGGGLADRPDTLVHPRPSFVRLQVSTGSTALVGPQMSMETGAAAAGGSRDLIWCSQAELARVNEALQAVGQSQLVAQPDHVTMATFNVGDAVVLAPVVPTGMAPSLATPLPSGSRPTSTCVPWACHGKHMLHVRSA